MANYEIDPAILQRYLPAFTELDDFNGKHYLSLVGFMFEDVKIKGMAIPFHTRFPEVNLRMYVKRTSKEGVVKRGVVFISEIVPKPAIAWVANLLYKEKYAAAKMKYTRGILGNQLSFAYGWRWKGYNNKLAVAVNKQEIEIIAGSKEEFIFEHYYGFSHAGKGITNQFTVEHPRWNVYPIINYCIDCHFAELYGTDFAVLDQSTPASVFVAAGSAVLIREKKVLR